MIDLYQKDWVNHLIVAGAILIIIFIIIGFFNVLPVFWGGSTPKISVPTCADCITEKDNNTEFAIGIPGEINIELPVPSYRMDGIKLTESSSGVLVQVGKPKNTSSAFWLVTFRTVKKGNADLVIQSRTASTSDFHISFLVE
jgi:hypothetical protein